MNLCIGERLDASDWAGLPLGRFAPPGHGPSLPVAAAQDTLFVWKDGASAARVRSRRHLTHYARHSGIFDIMAADEEAYIAHDVPEAPGECLLVAIPTQLREELGADRAGGRLHSQFGFTDPHLHELVRALECQCLEREPLGKVYTELVSATLVSYLVARYADASPAAPAAAKSGAGKLSTVQQRKVYRFVEERLGSNLSLRDLAGIVGYSQQHFVRLFRQTFSQTPHQFVIQMRVERAKRLLRADHQTLAEIASECGFADQSHFSVCFSRWVGLSPGRFRSEAL